MSTFLFNLWLFAHLIAKVAILTGLGPGLALAIAVEKYPYVFRWAKYLGMPVLGGERKGQPCRVLIRGKRNSCLIEFSDGFQATTSRNAIRKRR
jgi:hypothetical protein